MGLFSVKKRYYSDWTVQELACRLNEHPIELGETVYRVHKADEGVYALCPVSNPRLYGGRGRNSFVPEIDVFLWPKQDGGTVVELHFRPMRVVIVGSGLLFGGFLLCAILLLFSAASQMLSLYFFLAAAGWLLVSLIGVCVSILLAARRVKEVLEL